VDDLTPPSPPWTAEEVTTRIDEIVGGAWLPPTHLRDTYLEAMSHGDATCPGSTVEMTDPSTALEACTAGSGWSYQGHTVYMTNGAMGVDNFANWSLSADFRITNPADQFFTGGGGVLMSYLRAPGGTEEWTAEVYGSWQAEADEGWLGEGMSTMLTMSLSTTDSTQTIEINGGLGVLGSDIFLSEVVIGGPDCTETRGSIGLHDGRGYWYWVALDCGSCGPLTYAGQDLGEVCLALADLPEQISEAMAVP